MLTTNTYKEVRMQSLRLTEGLSDEDMLLQSMPDASPTKWHLAHTSWFFETFLLQPHLSAYQVFDDSYQYLFNSYYDSVGERHPRPERGLLSRPSLRQVLAYREHVDKAMQQLLKQKPDKKILDALTIGLHHEMQHQELMLTDIKHALASNPYGLPELTPEANNNTPTDSTFTHFKGGLIYIGTDSDHEFAYDCEQPRHQVFLHEFNLRNSLVSNQEWLAFIDDGGYQKPELWLSEGWALCQQEGWQAPLYWRQKDGNWQTMTLQGYRPVHPAEPVCHISYYEADAFARWLDYRLPTEFEWEHAARTQPLTGHFADSGIWHPRQPEQQPGLKQMHGDVWEWTQSAFAPYPGFQPPKGALGEYNGKFMINQMVLRGGSCATAHQQMRFSYRNFFHPHQRWQFSGLRLAR
ncbi:ergothioneine biosynthesis protein EgtB [Aliidiomarina minuta]|uniref:Ergothioneine biosynthesis protein EgtB n=1 Tax=Aliidiomarina minuta TaxID=880057 RepID=A0A432W7K1_9GAMM|nr:ergothioneine biosynthesis protein EgtB [Aliidiomarina minuta]RUO25981.1 ergothioneine biosynthesis protein EgtB [Aliidiomarina minuta]